jgi:hypothetical protein
MKLTAANKAIIASYARSVVGAGIASYIASGQDWKAALNALWAAALPVVMRYLNPKDQAFGRGANGNG